MRRNFSNLVLECRQNTHKKPQEIRITMNLITTRLPLPGKGKLNVRHRQMRGVWQIFAGRLYVTGASGDSPTIAAEELANQYEVAAGTLITVHGFREPYAIPAPEFDP
jgi:hypothetical protein